MFSEWNGDGWPWKDVISLSTFISYYNIHNPMIAVSQLVMVGYNLYHQLGCNLYHQQNTPCPFQWYPNDVPFFTCFHYIPVYLQYILSLSQWYAILSHYIPVYSNDIPNEIPIFHVFFLRFGRPGIWRRQGGRPRPCCSEDLLRPGPVGGWKKCSLSSMGRMGKLGLTMVIIYKLWV